MVTASWTVFRSGVKPVFSSIHLANALWSSVGSAAARSAKVFLLGVVFSAMVFPPWGLIGTGIHRRTTSASQRGCFVLACRHLIRLWMVAVAGRPSTFRLPGQSRPFDY